MKINTDEATIDIRDENYNQIEVLLELPAPGEEDTELCTLTIASDGYICCKTSLGILDIVTEYRIVFSKRGEFRIKKCRK